MAKCFLHIVVMHVVILRAAAVNPPPCESKVYCIGGPGSLLHTMQMARIDNDSKTFVDKKLKYLPDEVIENFNTFMEVKHGRPSKAEVLKFMDENFDPEGSEFEDWNPADWKENPAFLKKIIDPQLRDWATELNVFWKELGRQIKKDVQVHAEMYSQIYLPHPVVIPGGRFREVYYWDTYWIVQGLLHSEMYNTVRGMLENFIHLVGIYGKVPNGGRIYYKLRSQPPLLIPMAKLYMDATNDKDFLREGIGGLENEYLFWKNNRMAMAVSVDGKNYHLAKYTVLVTGPRPESYREDYENGQFFMDSEERERFYVSMKTAAESGWDFSTRWFIDDEGTNKGNLTNVHTQDIIPVDLNAYMCMNARLLSEFYTKLNMTVKAQQYKDEMDIWREGIERVLWDEAAGVWFDYDLLNQKRRNYFFLSNIAPLFALCYNKTESDTVVPKVLKYLKQSGSLKYPGGVPTSMNYSGQQWDFPNAWPPLQHILVIGLNSTENVEAQYLAFDVAEKWVQSNYQAYLQSDHKMFEKYNVTVIGLPGEGGEYQTVIGFGWTNGVILDFLAKYGDRLTATVGRGYQVSASVKVIFACLGMTAVLALGLLG